MPEPEITVLLVDDQPTVCHGPRMRLALEPDLRVIGEAEDAAGNEIWPLPGTRLGPRISFHHRFAAPGLYKLWGQFQTADGQVITAEFVLRAE